MKMPINKEHIKHHCIVCNQITSEYDSIQDYDGGLRRENVIVYKYIALTLIGSVCTDCHPNLK